MRKQILFILSTLVLLMYPLSLSAQNSTADDHVLTLDFGGRNNVPVFILSVHFRTLLYQNRTLVELRT